ncbi:hypothetical protein BCR42DRAFT_417598 [Absidia repens]|uniref:Uncharacterized protein n=1 Tax=Absidia repens TaxID=90262 RepID=A0A1X2IE33_9FUNG|nr:hypothetical protein BCR42DRAFT_417598 [Absidia repens]
MICSFYYNLHIIIYIYIYIIYLRFSEVYVLPLYTLIYIYISPCLSYDADYISPYPIRLFSI